MSLEQGFTLAFKIILGLGISCMTIVCIVLCIAMVGGLWAGEL